MVAARTLLTPASLYAKIDLSRSIEVLTDAVNCINRIESPDFVSDDQAKTYSVRSLVALRFHVRGNKHKSLIAANPDRKERRTGDEGF